MHQKIILTGGWITLILAMIAMIIGHTGNTDLQWQVNQISTYAATAPRHEWIMAAMILPCLSLVCISILTSRYKMLGDTHLAHTVPLFTGSAIAGLLTLAGFKETARTISILKSSGFDAIRQQSFHDAGLLIFFYSDILLAVVFGILIISRSAAWTGRILGGAVLLLGVAAFPLMTTPWPRMIGILTAGPGLKQRASLFSLWLAIALVLAAVSSPLLRQPSRRG